MPAPLFTYIYILIYIYIYILIYIDCIDTYFIYLSVYDGETYKEKQKLIYKNSVSCSLTDKQPTSVLNHGVRNRVPRTSEPAVAE